MIVDTSAIIAILAAEADGPVLLSDLIEATVVKISSGTLLETAIVSDSRSAPAQRRRLDELVRRVGMQVVPFDAEQLSIARAAYQDFGRGSGHPARLNFGDCFAYALAVVSGEPLLFIGDDFAATGIRSARAP